MSRLLHIVPRCPPAIDGVGDYATQLGRKLEERFGVESDFLSADPNQPVAVSTYLLRERSAEALFRALIAIAPNQLLLHYSGYGFDRRGTPMWLPDGIDRFLSVAPTKLQVFFHEIWSSGPPWSGRFFAQPLQKKVVRRLQSSAQTAFTSTPKMQRLLDRGSESIELLPVSSAVDVPFSRYARSPNDALKLIVFGQEHTRTRTLAAHARLLRFLIETNCLNKLLLVGKNANSREAKTYIQSEAVICPIANASTSEIAHLLSESDAFLSFYPANLLTKSSTAMAALACGCPIILSNGEGDHQFDPRPPYLLCDGSKSSIRNLLEGGGSLWPLTAEAGVNWYRKHASWDVVSEKLGRALFQPATVELAAVAA